MFRVNMTSEEFQQIISQVITDFSGTYNMSYDIVLVVKTGVDHDTKLTKMIQRLTERVMTFNGKMY